MESFNRIIRDAIPCFCGKLFLRSKNVFLSLDFRGVNHVRHKLVCKGSKCQESEVGSCLGCYALNFIRNQESGKLGKWWIRGAGLMQKRATGLIFSSSMATGLASLSSIPSVHRSAQDDNAVQSDYEEKRVGAADPFLLFPLSSLWRLSS